MSNLSLPPHPGLERLFHKRMVLLVVRGEPKAPFIIMTSCGAGSRCPACRANRPLLLPASLAN